LLGNRASSKAFIFGSHHVFTVPTVFLHWLCREQGQQSVALLSVAAGINMNDGTVGKWSKACVAAVDLAAPFRDCSELLQGKC